MVENSFEPEARFLITKLATLKAKHKLYYKSVVVTYYCNTVFGHRKQSNEMSWEEGKGQGF